MNNYRNCVVGNTLHEDRKAYLKLRDDFFRQQIGNVQRRRTVETQFSIVTMSSAVTNLAMSYPNVTVDHTSAVSTFSAIDFSNHTQFDDTSSALTAILQIVFVITGLVGIVVNGFVLFALFVLKEFRKNTTNIFICNQSVLDAVACIALTATMMVQKTAASRLCGGI
jgi:hypothetical protein